MRACGGICRPRAGLGHTACTLLLLERVAVNAAVIQFADRRCFVHALYTPLKELAVAQQIPGGALK